MAEKPKMRAWDAAKVFKLYCLQLITQNRTDADSSIKRGGKSWDARTRIVLAVVAAFFLSNQREQGTPDALKVSSLSQDSMISGMGVSFLFLLRGDFSLCGLSATSRSCGRSSLLLLKVACEVIIESLCGWNTNLVRHSFFHLPMSVCPPLTQ